MPAKNDPLEHLDESTLGLLKNRVERLQLDCVHRLDDGPQTTWPDLFMEDCLYRITSRENWKSGSDLGIIRCESVGMLRDRITASQHAAVYAPRVSRHVLGGAVIDKTKSDKIHSRTNVAIYQTNADGDTLLLMAAIYHDIITETSHGLKFQEKHLVYDTLRLPDSVIGPL